MSQNIEEIDSVMLFKRDARTVYEAFKMMYKKAPQSFLDVRGARPPGPVRLGLRSRSSVFTVAICCMFGRMKTVSLKSLHAKCVISLPVNLVYQQHYEFLKCLQMTQNTKRA